MLLKILISFLVFGFECQCNSETQLCTIKRPDRIYPLAMLMLPKNFSMFPWPLTIPAIKIALEKVKSMPYMNPIVKSLKTLEPVDSICVETNYALYRGVQTFVTQMPDVLFGPICGYVLAPIARLLAFWNIPILSTGAVYYGFRKERKSEFKTLTRIGSGHLDLVLGQMIQKTFKKYKWTHGIYIYHKTAYTNVIPLYCHALGGYLTQEFEITVDYWPIRQYKELTTATLTNDTALEQFLIDAIGNKYAVAVLCVDPASVHRILLKADQLNFNNGEYVFINIGLFSSGNETKYPWYLTASNQSENSRAKRAYRSLLSVTLKIPENEKFRNFSDQVKEMASREYNYHYEKDLINTFVSNFYDGVLLYAHALNKTLADGGAISNGSLIIKNMWNTTFEGIGGTVTIDSSGDRIADFSILDMDPKTGEFKPVAHFIGTKSSFLVVPNVSVDWGSVSNVIPSTKPRCGYDNSMCPKPDKNLNIGAISAGVMGCLFLISFSAGYFVYRNIKLQAELNAMNWIIPWESLETSEKIRNLVNHNCVKYQSKPIHNSKVKVHQSRSQNVKGTRNEMENLHLLHEVEKPSSKISRNNSKNFGNPIYKDLDLISCASLETIAGINLDKIQNAQLFTKTALYKGNVVALKPILSQRRIDINRQLLIQVKKVKDLNNDHICRFIGACLEIGYQYMVYDYCPKGSLEDVLAKEQITLDWVFKYSLIQDICRGMVYLHNNLGPIGTLKSSNCLVDSRFVLKITDFGLISLRGSKQYLLEEDSNVYFKNLLWTAPELLRMSNPPLDGTFKGDVYSFAIVCQEIVYRKGVFSLDSEDDFSAQEIVESVKAENSPNPFRPSLTAIHGCTEDFVLLIKQSWNEDPVLRPDFNTIKYHMRKFNKFLGSRTSEEHCIDKTGRSGLIDPMSDPQKQFVTALDKKEGDSGNILDNLLSRMEQYANNLEDIVQERTEQYLEEKKKAEDLLYSMLPKSVAHQLIKNQPVNAESYDLVTIFFSDIVGFTALSAESTPMQIIDLLNRLYTTFDSIIENYDVYKVETIGDAYMVCSGLPQLNGNLHAREIARMAIAFLSAIFCFVIPHRPDKELKLRIGIHSGPVCSGVVGLKMPRYCLFGDTVNTSSRMESNGLPHKIHISQSTMQLLKTFGTFLMTERGHIEVKGKGSTQTYWLHGENELIVDPVPKDAFLL